MASVNPILIILIYLLIVNLVDFILMGVDKKRARNHEWRVPEAAFFIWAIVGGSIGAILGMYTFRHKTRHWYFVWGMPAILILEVVLVVVLVQVFHIDISVM